MKWFENKLGIDLGTANTLVFLPQKGIVINEPTVVAITLDDNRVLAVGQEAKDMLGRTPETIVARRPMRDGVIADYRVTEAMLRYFISKALGGFRLLRPEVMISVPGGVTSTERRAVMDAAKTAGARQAFVIKETVAAAIGAGIPIGSAAGNLVIDIGGGTTDVAVLSLGGIVTSTSVRVAGNRLDQSIADYVRKKHNLAIGDRTAEEAKIAIGSAVRVPEEDTIQTKGRDSITGLPRTITLQTNEIVDSLQEDLQEMVRAIKQVLQDTPPELVSDIIDKGMVLTGGTAQLRNLDTYISRAIGVPCYVADEPMLCVAKGTGVALDNLDIYKRSILSIK